MYCRWFLSKHIQWLVNKTSRLNHQSPWLWKRKKKFYCEDHPWSKSSLPNVKEHQQIQVCCDSIRPRSQTGFFPTPKINLTPANCFGSLWLVNARAGKDTSFQPARIRLIVGDRGRFLLCEQPRELVWADICASTMRQTETKSADRIATQQAASSKICVLLFINCVRN